METKKKGFPTAFWVCACTEIFERLAYYLGRSLILIFVTASVATGGLGLSDTVAANMQSNLTAFSYLLPLFGAVISISVRDIRHRLVCLLLRQDISPEESQRVLPEYMR